MTTLRERIETTRVAVELFPRCLKCNGDLTNERLSNLIPVIGRENRYVHHCCPRTNEDAA